MARHHLGNFSARTTPFSSSEGSLDSLQILLTILRCERQHEGSNGWIIPPDV